MINKRVLSVFAACSSAVLLTVNQWFIVGVVLGIASRCYSGHIISITIGSTVGILIVEFIKFILHK